MRAAQAAPRGTLALTMYDWGGSCVSPLGRPQTCNRRVYGREQPPTYDLARLEGVPLAVVWGGEDKLADPLDVRRLLYVLPQASLKLAVVRWGGVGRRLGVAGTREGLCTLKGYVEGSSWGVDQRFTQRHIIMGPLWADSGVSLMEGGCCKVTAGCHAVQFDWQSSPR